MDSSLDEFEKVAATVEYSEPQIGLMSNVSGKLATLRIRSLIRAIGELIFGSRCVLLTP